MSTANFYRTIERKDQSELGPNAKSISGLGTPN